MHTSTFIPNVENGDIFDDFDYLFGCPQIIEENECINECPITTQ